MVVTAAPLHMPARVRQELTRTPFYQYSTCPRTGHGHKPFFVPVSRRFFPAMHPVNLFLGSITSVLFFSIDNHLHGHHVFINIIYFFYWNICRTGANCWYQLPAPIAESCCMNSFLVGFENGISSFANCVDIGRNYTGVQPEKKHANKKNYSQSRLRKWLTVELIPHTMLTRYVRPPVSPTPFLALVQQAHRIFLQLRIDDSHPVPYSMYPTNTERKFRNGFQSSFNQQFACEALTRSWTSSPAGNLSFDPKPANWKHWSGLVRRPGNFHRCSPFQLLQQQFHFCNFSLLRCNDGIGEPFSPPGFANVHGCWSAPPKNGAESCPSCTHGHL